MSALTRELSSFDVCNTFFNSEESDFCATPFIEKKRIRQKIKSFFYFIKPTGFQLKYMTFRWQLSYILTTLNTLYTPSTFIRMI